MAASVPRLGFVSCVALALSFAVACSSELRGGSAGFVDDDGPAVKIAFRPPTTLALEPRETSVLELAVTPEGVYTVRLALLPGEGTGPNDAVLDSSEVTSDHEGIAHVALTAPSGPTSFHVRATIDGAGSATLPVSVSAAGFVSLEVTPAYRDERTVTNWIASVHVGVSCESLSDLASESALSAEAPFPESAVVGDVPVGVVLAVTARAGRNVAGCTNVPAVVEGLHNRARVTMKDLPVRLDRSALDLTLSLETRSPEWISAFEREVEAVQAAMVGDAPNDFTALLDAMQGLAESGQEFAIRRAEAGWDENLVDAYGGEVSVLRDAVGRWMRAGQLALAAPGSIEAGLDPLPEPPGKALLTFTRVAGSVGSAAGVPGAHEVQWSADPNDMVLIGGDVAWYPAELFGAAALTAAVKEFDSAETLADALALDLNCTAVASEMGPAYDGCSLFCTSSLCKGAVQELWARGVAPAMNAASLLEFSAAARATVGEGAEIVALDGDWVGQWLAADGPATAGGPLQAADLGDQAP